MPATPCQSLHHFSFTQEGIKEVWALGVGVLPERVSQVLNHSTAVDHQYQTWSI